MDAKDFITINLQYLQNIITISSALLLLVPAFIEKVFDTHYWKYASYLAIVGFILAILGSVGGQVGLSFITAGIYSSSSSNEAFGTVIARISQIVMWIGFLLGIISLATFILKNISKK